MIVKVIQWIITLIVINAVMSLEILPINYNEENKDEILLVRRLILYLLTWNYILLFILYTFLL